VTGPGYDAAEAAERRLAEALRLQAAGAASPIPPPGPSHAARRREVPPLLWALAVALLAGALLGTGLALLSMLAPGLLPALG
jgi:hypothetical protein